MKKSLLIAAIALVCGTMAYAQPRAIGGRLGYGAEFSYEHTMDAKNMISLEVGAPGFAGLEVACTYDWIDPFNTAFPWEEKGEWHWYMGVGGAIQAPWNFKGLFLGAAGRVGVEYDFWFPLQLSFDWRPALGVGLTDNGTGGLAAGFGHDLYFGGIGLGVRYFFNQKE